MADLRDKYDSDFWNARGFGHYCHDIGVDPVEDGLVFTICEVQERMVRNPASMREELCHVITFWEHRKVLIISNANSEELFWCVGSETDNFPEKRIKLHLIEGSSKNPYWLRVKAERIPAASSPFLPNVAEGIQKRLAEFGGSPEGFLAWAKDQHLLILERFPSHLRSAKPADWCIGMLDDIVAYAGILKVNKKRADDERAEKEAEEARNQTPEPTEAQLASRGQGPPPGSPPVRARDVEITEDDIPF